MQFLYNFASGADYKDSSVMAKKHEEVPQHALSKCIFLLQTTS